MSKVWIGAALALLGCGGGKSANCELTVEGAAICLSSEMSASFCEGDLGGAASEADSSDDPTCADLGYPVECNGELAQSGDGAEVTYLRWYAIDDAGCEASNGGSITLK